MRASILSLFLIQFLYFSCNPEVDDQRLIKESQNQYVNPTPTERNFNNINENHKIIVAVIDSGIDYNHPFLLENMHFQLDSDDNPIGIGWDYLGEDTWPAPYIARTDLFNTNASSKEISDSKKMAVSGKKLIEEYPEIIDMFPPQRNIEAEMEGSFEHGTHVAGLIGFDSPEIGIIGYRVLKVNRVPEQVLRDNKNFIAKKILNDLIDATKKAIKAGARVLNMSLGVTVLKDMPSSNIEIYNKFQEDMIKIAQNNPNVVFVVAAGNDGRWIDGKSVKSLPCYLPVKNVLCVGAISEDKTFTTFTNIVLSEDVHFIFAWGEDIYSTYPSNSCNFNPVGTLDRLSFNYSRIAKGLEERKSFAKKAMKECSHNNKLKKMSGTSMACPIAARSIAKILAGFPSLDGESAIKELYNSAHYKNLGSLRLKYLEVVKPSWYHLVEN